MQTMQREKINDYFEYPHKIDLSSYLSPKTAKEHSETAEYRLVGVIVHSGRAEAGHYYSFIKVRNITIR